MSYGNIVSVREESVTIPAYKGYPPEKSPLFIEKRAYQGSTGKVYPLPVTEKISDKKEDVVYRAIFLENEYLLVMILPEIGGRIQRAYDKTNGYDFIYYNHVIKPALVGLTGPWISGGIELNWPQHHRPTTFSPVDSCYTRNPDGSCSVFVGETDKMYGTKGMAKISLYPGKAYIEIKGQLYNPTDVPQTFLWWANPAVPVNDHTYSVFPPDVHAVMDHGRRAVSTFPIAIGEYYKADYSAGVDISRYKNIKVPTSYMADHSDFDFIGNYDESLHAGMLHVADHHIAPGKKQWTWGSGDFGCSWDRNLTDADGPYIELMTGVFTENQPDFSWLKPYEEKTFEQYFLPYKGVGHVSNATKEAVLGIDVSEPGKVVVRVYVTGEYQDAQIRITEGNRVIGEKTTDLSPETCLAEEFPAPEQPEKCHASVFCGGRLLAECGVPQRKPEPVPHPAEPLKDPVDLKSTEELYLAATHLEQYRHATYRPEDYYLEGLRRDPTDIRLNNGYGLFQFRRGNFRESIRLFQAAIRKQTWKNPNPYYGECYFNLGLALEKSGDEKGAYDAFYKATWNSETSSAGFTRLAFLSARKKQYDQALKFVEKALRNNGHSMKARTLKAALLRKIGADRRSLLKESHSIDPLDMGTLYECAQNGGDSQGTGAFSSWLHMMRTPPHNYLVLSLDYLRAGFYEDALFILKSCPDPNPMVFYYMGYAAHLNGNDFSAGKCCRKAEQLPEDGCFPNKLDEILILNDCIGLLPHAPMAEYYLGNLLYDKEQYAKATVHWEKAVAGKPSLAMGFRNLSIAYYNKEQNGKKAKKAIGQACLLDPEYPRFWLERDQLAAKSGDSVESRLSVLRQRLDLVQSRDDLYLRYIMLLNCCGEYEKALDGLLHHKFHPWEGGEGRVSAQYRFSLIHLAKQAMALQEYEKAIGLLKRTLHYPDSLGEGKLPNVPDNQAYYYMGFACRRGNRKKQAEESFRLATLGEKEPGPALYYNEQPSDFIYYQGLAWEALGNPEEARKPFHRLIAYGEEHLFDKVSYDYFAVSLPDAEAYQEDIARNNVLYCQYLRALGKLGLGQKEEAAGIFSDILKQQPDHQGALEHRQDDEEGGEGKV